jgi:catechol 2,3-dioxygenase-like lactoylglutathione lyase family enzyme
MMNLKGVAHFCIPVSDVMRSVKWYEEVVGLTRINGDERQFFMDAGGMCVILCHEPEPVNKENSGDLVHHAFMISEEQYKQVPEHLAKHGVEILYEEDRRTGTVNGPRTYFRDPDGTRLEFIYLTSYNKNRGKK